MDFARPQFLQASLEPDIGSFPIRTAIESINARVRYDEADAHERLAHTHLVGQEAAAAHEVDNHLGRSR